MAIAGAAGLLKGNKSSSRSAPTVVGFVAKGGEPVERVLESPLAAVPHAAWTSFVKALATAPLKSVSPSNALGMFEISPRRLAELGMIRNLRTVMHKGRSVYTGEPVAPFSPKAFLESPTAQYDALVKSMREYDAAIARSEIELPDGVSRAGALAILHRAGRGGLAKPHSLFPATKALYLKTKDLF